MYRIDVADSAEDELGALSAYDQKMIVENIEKQLSHEPTRATRRRKHLESVTPSFESVPPVWQLRIEEYRVFYDVDELEKVVNIRAVRHKPPEARTEDIL